MKRYYLLSLFLGLLLLTACPYESHLPIDDGSYAAPQWIVGKWQEVKENGNGDKYEIGKIRNGIIAAFELDSIGKRKGVPTKIILSKLGNKIYANVYENGADEMSEEGYYIYKFTRITDTEFELLPLKENATIKGLNELKEYLIKNENNDDIFEFTEKARYKKI